MKTRKSTLLATLIFMGLTQLNAQDDPFGITDPSIPIWPTSQGGEYWAVQSEPCRRDATPWYLGGNNVPYFYRPISDIGTCNDAPFVLKAFNRQSVFLLQNSRLGIGYGNFSPAAAVDIKNSDPGNDPNRESHFRIYADEFGNIESTTDINMSFAPGKNLNFNEGTALQVNTPINPPLMSILSGGRVVVGVDGPFAANANYKFDVYSGANSNGGSNDGINLTTNDDASIAYNVLNATSLKNNFTVFGSGKTNMGYQAGAPNVAMLNINLAGQSDAINVYDQNSSNTNKVTFRVDNTGRTNIGSGRPAVGAASANAMLSVDGLILATEIRVAANPGTHWADYVFEKNYQPMPLAEVEKFVSKNKHLPEVPSESEVIIEGIDLTRMNVILLKKVEELYLYSIELKKESEVQKQMIEKLSEQIKAK